MAVPLLQARGMGAGEAQADGSSLMILQVTSLALSNQIVDCRRLKCKALPLHHPLNTPLKWTLFTWPAPDPRSHASRQAEL